MGDKPPIIDAEFEVITGPYEPQPAPEPPEEWNGVGFPPDLVKEGDSPLWATAKQLFFAAQVIVVMLIFAFYWRKAFNWLLALGS